MLAASGEARRSATCLTGKWHLGSLPEQGPNHFGFDHSYGSLAGGVSPWNHRYKQGPFTQTWHRDEKFVEEPGPVTDLIAAEACRWIQSRGPAPFLLYVPFTAVHLPLKDPSETKSQADRQPQRVRELEQVMAEISARDRDAVASE